MRLRKIALALFACLALGAVAANAAMAEGTGWTIGTIENQTTAGTLIPNGTHERVRCRKNPSTAHVLTLSANIGGANVALKAEGIDCIEKAGSTRAATIDDTTTPNHSEGILTFTEVTVEEPSSCTVTGTAQSMGVDLTTNPLTDTVIMDPTNKTTGPIYDKFTPEAANDIWIEIELTGALCPVAEIRVPIKGSACGEAVNNNNTTTPNKTGTLTKVQTLTFGKAQQETGGCALTLGTGAAVLKGLVDNELESGKPFGSD